MTAVTRVITFLALVMSFVLPFSIITASHAMYQIPLVPHGCDENGVYAEEISNNRTRVTDRSFEVVAGETHTVTVNGVSVNPSFIKQTCESNAYDSYRVEFVVDGVRDKTVYREFIDGELVSTSYLRTRQ
jgi:hypothetical protein